MNNQKNETVVSIGDWILTLFIVSIPLIGFVMLFIWAFGSQNISKSKANWAKATLIWMAIGIIFSSLIFMMFLILGVSANNYY
ncbi:MAG TPA: hypothetical protein VKN74_00870 [Candidatus Mcinerneyibacterium sp.]|nr:hypothetical protein [Candidatus Mcinerneyibacterium sp.]